MANETKWKKYWIDDKNARINAQDMLFQNVAWEKLQVFNGTGAELPYVLASLTGREEPPFAFGYLEEACFHQGSKADAAKPVAQALIAMLEAGIGSRDQILNILADLPFRSLLPKAAVKKYNLGGEAPAGDGRHSGLLKFEGSKWLCEYGLKEGKLDGSFKALRKPGVVAFEGLYLQGEKTGHWRHYHAQGWLESEGDYKSGRQQGLWITYESQGSRRREEIFMNGKLHGLFRAYHFNSKVKEEGQYIQGKKDGHWREWYYSGAPKRECVYSKGKAKGPIKAWDESGNPIA